MIDPPNRNSLSHSPDHPGESLTLAERCVALICDELSAADLVLIAGHDPLPCHALKQQGQRGPCFLRHPQRLVDFSAAQTVAGLVINHRQH